MPHPSLLFSVRMRASSGGPHEEGGRHLSGAERLAAPDELEQVALGLLRRGRASGPDHLRISVDRLPECTCHAAPCLPVTTVDLPSADAAWAYAAGVLLQAGISPQAVEAGFRLLLVGPQGDGQPTSGAVLLESNSGERVQTPSQTGLRASRFDYDAATRSQVQAVLNDAGLGHFRTFEALALATKVIWSGVTAELCWSDAQDYMAGYVATAADGYVRFPAFKPEGATGGRVFYVSPETPIIPLIARLTRTPLLIDTVPTVTLRNTGDETQLLNPEF